MHIEDMSIDQLMEKNKIICPQIDQLQGQKNIGAELIVSGTESDLQWQEGTKVRIVTKISRKSVIVLVEDDSMRIVQGLAGATARPAAVSSWFEINQLRYEVGAYPLFALEKGKAPYVGATLSSSN